MLLLIYLNIYLEHTIKIKNILEENCSTHTIQSFLQNINTLKRFTIM